ncbi:alkaline phytoceramidase [Alkalilimnicola ehrlichii MLHE-1]|nr:alkaline phytoceramidase [Alkalilimnicola ehrlichii]
MARLPGKGALMRSGGLWLTLLGAALVAAVWLWVPPIPQPEAYHDFADQRRVLGIPHFGDVISNGVFLLVGLYGLLQTRRLQARQTFRPATDAWPYYALFAATVGVAFGSIYYHLDPDHWRLYWDRLPISLAFMAIFTAVLGERLPARVTPWLLPLLLLIGAAGATHWLVTELSGQGDLRLYLLVQAVPILVAVVWIGMRGGRYTRGGDVIAAAGWYLLALVLENLDALVFEATGGWVSGHTLKHLLAGVALYWLARMLRLRRRRGALA